MVPNARHKRSDPTLLSGQSICLVSGIEESGAGTGVSGVQPQKLRSGKNLDPGHRYLRARESCTLVREHDFPLRFR